MHTVHSLCCVCRSPTCSLALSVFQWNDCIHVGICFYMCIYIHIYIYEYIGYSSLCAVHCARLCMQQQACCFCFYRVPSIKQQSSTLPGAISQTATCVSLITQLCMYLLCVCSNMSYFAFKKCWLYVCCSDSIHANMSSNHIHQPKTITYMTPMHAFHNELAEICRTHPFLHTPSHKSTNMLWISCISLWT